MTNYNEKLDEILSGFAMHAAWWGFDKALETEGEHTSSTREEALNEAKQALTSLIKELVEEAMPEYISPDQPLGLKYQGRNEAIWEFEQNLLKALEEVSEMTPQTPEKFTIPAHGHYPEWSVTIEELLTLGRMRRYGRGGWNTKEDLSLSLLGQYHSRAEWEWYDDGKKMDFYNEQILPRIDEIWEYYQSNKKRIDKINKAEFNRRYK